MSKLINNAGVQRFANKLCDANNRKVGSKSLPTALNDIDTLIEQMKSHFANEYGTPLDLVLENNKNIFSVGSGGGVNRSTDVENGFTDIMLYGNSVVNLIQEKSYMDWHVLYCGRKTTEGIFIGRGPKYANASYPDHITSTDVRCKLPSKKNTTYTFIFDAKVIEGTSPEFTIVYNGICHRKTANIRHGKNVVLVFSDETENGTFQIYGLNGSNGETNINIRLTNMMILEGDWTNKPIPEYFRGMKSFGENNGEDHKIDISSLGSNLFDFTNNCGYECGYSFGFPHETGTKLESLGNRYRPLPNGFYFKTRTDCNHLGVGFYIKVEKHTDYTFSCSVKSDHRHSVKCQGIYSSEIPFRTYNTQRSLLISNEVINNRVEQTFNSSTFDYVFFFIGGAWERVVTSYKEFEFTDIQLQKSDSRTEFDIYRNDKKQISLNEPLRGLPNGVSDSIEKINGDWKIVRRCVEVTLDGSETPWWKNTDFDGSDVLFFYISTKHCQSLPNGKVKPGGGSIYIHCDSFPTQILKDRVSNKHNNIEGIFYSDSLNALIQFHINKSRLKSTEIQAFKDWLSENPVKLIYELDQYIIEDIDPITLQCWKNGTILIDGLIPVKTTHTVALNKPAQIKKNIEELTELKNRVLDLENLLETSSLEHSLQLQLLNQSINLDK